MTALLAVEFEPEAAPAFAVNALRRPPFVIRALDVGRGEVIATVEVESGEALEAALVVLQGCPGVRSSAAFAEG